MHRKIIFISSGILFILISAGMSLIAAGQSYKLMILLFAVSVPFFFVGFWNIYSVMYEYKTVYPNEYFTFRSGGPLSAGIGAYYNKKIIVPVFLILFGCAVLGIVSGLLVVSADEIALILTLSSFIYAITVTVYFLLKLNKELKTGFNTDIKNINDEELQNSTDDIAVKIAFFFASIATLGLFPLGYYIYKKLR